MQAVLRTVAARIALPDTPDKHLLFQGSRPRGPKKRLIYVIIDCIRRTFAP